MSIAARFPSVKKPRFYRSGEKQTMRLKVMRTGLVILQQGRRLRYLLTRLRPVATWNLHTTQPNTMFPTCDEVVNLTGLLETKGISVSSESSESMQVK
jgi:hypothetical protein